MEVLEFKPFPKWARPSRDCIITEKLDGTNAQVLITEEGGIFAGSRKRWITPADDNYGFAAWVESNKDELLKLGPGQHFGEWWGAGIQRHYGLAEKRFSLFNTERWIPGEGFRGTDKQKIVPGCCHVVPVLYQGLFETNIINKVLQNLAALTGSVAAPGFSDPEGIVIFHTASGVLFKKTCVNDESPKSKLPL